MRYVHIKNKAGSIQFFCNTHSNSFNSQVATALFCVFPASTPRCIDGIWGHVRLPRSIESVWCSCGCFKSIPVQAYHVHVFNTCNEFIEATDGQGHLLWRTIGIILQFDNCSWYFLALSSFVNECIWLWMHICAEGRQEHDCHALIHYTNRLIIDLDSVYGYDELNEAWRWKWENRKFRKQWKNGKINRINIRKQKDNTAHRVNIRKMTKTHKSRKRKTSSQARIPQ